MQCNKEAERHIQTLASQPHLRWHQRSPGECGRQVAIFKLSKMISASRLGYGLHFCLDCQSLLAPGGPTDRRHGFIHSSLAKENGGLWRAVPHGLPSRNRAVHGLRVVVVSTWRRRISTRPGRRGVAASSAGASAAAEGAAGGAERRKQLSLEKFLMLPEKWTKATNASANARSPSPTSDAETASSRLGATRARRQLMLENAAAKGDLEHLRDLLEVLQIRASECASVSYLTHGQRFAV
eukprot:g9841.t1